MKVGRRMDVSMLILMVVMVVDLIHILLHIIEGSISISTSAPVCFIHWFALSLSFSSLFVPPLALVVCIVLY
jgi:hypothetical protein